MREKSINPYQGGGDVSPRGHKNPRSGEGHAGAGAVQHPPGLQLRRGCGLPLRAGNGVCAPTAGLSHRPPPPPAPLARSHLAGLYYRHGEAGEK